MENKGKTGFPGVILSTALLLLAWHAASLVLAKPFLPPPTAAAAAFIQLLVHGDLARHFLVSAARVLISTVLALATAAPLGVLLGRSAWAARLGGPLIAMLYPLPKVVFLPVFVVLLGLGNAPKILLITLVIFFQIAVVTRDAAAAVPAASLLSLRSLNAGSWQILRNLILPCCLPHILTSLRITTGTAIAVLFFAETFASFDGLGYFILNGMETREYTVMYAGIIGMGLLGLLFYALIGLAERIFCAWRF
ncbi:MAG: ABC transporter permease subunit [Gracilibacteraceae bacterium]|jgi:NitT/TauT family transport system permease protein|nr:ABC transporter permease subunit [Gracilibacteraceae bacterium]